MKCVIAYKEVAVMEIKDSITVCRKRINTISLCQAPFENFLLKAGIVSGKKIAIDTAFLLQKQL